ncbi:hypothetical protein ANOM_007055 [Aspergillus nomiae NRRL 13137]|uniref:BTB domain-containing protein n=1 Tax=Aspergillus nomiae NRRL (strain ATCC 15546 / NRRL 13137 / CBS 260.88 / M93) TaxID=1509407 RepID=A0A0L1J1C8_ASPN3|nr:uncharacterized protein ANOM_007055 [Aspergillus nomiae NRRL 13137]KNG85554.1 hypothetical protein ANOM_007055 [Aspergillus nomiae NRRL 13137]
MRVGLSSEDLRSICRPSSSGPALKTVETQVDDSSEQQKAQQDRKKEKRRLKKKLLKEEKKRRKEEAKQGEAIDLPPSLDSSEVNIGNTQHPSSITATMSSQSVVDEAPPSYNGLSGIPLETSSADTSSSHTVRPSSQKAEEPEEQNESCSIYDENNPIICHLHGRNISSSEHHTIATEILPDRIDPLSEHLLHCLEASEFSDSQIILRSSKDIFMPIVFRTHRAVISRSNFMADVFRSPTQEERINEIVAVGNENFCMIKGFEYALQHLYGRPLLTAGQLRLATLSTYGYSENNVGKIQFSLTAAMADFALCYAASGAFFQQEAVIETGIRLAIELIDWETVECILYFGVCTTRPAVTLDQTAPVNKTGDYDAARELQRWAPRLVGSALHFVTRHMSKDFTLYAKAQSKTLPNRIPESLYGVPGPVITSPRSFASRRGETPNREIEVPSAMLIYLPYKQLEETFGIMNARNILSSDLAQAVVAERETRRLQALRALAKQGVKDELNATDQIRELGYKEIVAVSEEQGPAITLNREWIGLAVVEETVATPRVKRVVKKHKRHKRKR